MLFPTNNLPHFSPAVHSPGRLAFSCLDRKKSRAQERPAFDMGTPERKPQKQSPRLPFVCALLNPELSGGSVFGLQARSSRFLSYMR